MRTVDIIIKKRERQELTREEIEFFVKGFTSGEIPDYQAADLAMAILLNGMSAQETTDLPLAMAHSGDMIDLSDVVDYAVDKHSTGGVGDKTSLVVLPIVSSCGLSVGKMSGRGLGFTGGTLDKLESIPGFRVSLSIPEFKRQLKDIGIVLVGQSPDLAPADGKMYSLRDVTGTVPSIPLIASSIMSKKLAGGAQAMVLDVKTGAGAVMQSMDDARYLASLMVDISKLSGRSAIALISDMNQPLGSAVGNALELIEAIDTLKGMGPRDFREHCLHVSVQMLVLGKKAKDLNEARTMAEESIRSGAGFAKFRELVKAQGGDPAYVDDVSRLPKARYTRTIVSPDSGYVAEVHARKVGEASVALGAGRAKKSDAIDHAVGFVIQKKVGDKVDKGDPLFTVHANDEGKLDTACKSVLAAYSIRKEIVKPLPLFYP